MLSDVMKTKSIIILLLIFLLRSVSCLGAFILVPMDTEQTNHLKAYGIAYWTLQKGNTLEWLLNYRGGSFLIPYFEEIQQECILRGIKTEILFLPPERRRQRHQRRA